MVALSVSSTAHQRAVVRQRPPFFLKDTAMPRQPVRSLPLGRIAAATLFALGASAQAAPLPPADSSKLAREVLSQLVALDATHAHGSTRSAELIEQRLLAAGFAREDVQLLAPADHPSKGNVVVRLRGRCSTSATSTWSRPSAPTGPTTRSR